MKHSSDLPSDLLAAQADLLTRRPRKDGSGAAQPRPVAEIVARAISTPQPPPEAALPADVAPARLDDLDLSWHPLVGTAVAAARSWQQRRRQQAAAGQKTNASLILVSTAVPGDINRSGYGCGKTHVARACLWSIAYVIDGEPVAPAGKFFMAGDIINRLDGETHASNELAGAPVVVVDDAGDTEGLIPFVRQDDRSQALERQARYFKLIDYCYSAGVSLIITGNLTLDALASHVGGRAWSRLLEMAPAGQMVDLTGVPDYRRQTGGR